MFYLRFRGIGAIYGEWWPAFTVRQIFRILRCNGETIVDLLWLRLILTPERVLERSATTQD